MSTGNGNGAGRIHLLNDHRPPTGAKTDDQGRVLKHNATVLEAHQIAVEEGTKIHEFYMNQIPPFVARMIQDALVAYGLIKLTDEAQLAATPPADGSIEGGANEARHNLSTGPAGGSAPSDLDSQPADVPPVVDIATDGSEGGE